MANLQYCFNICIVLLVTVQPIVLSLGNVQLNKIFTNVSSSCRNQSEIFLESLLRQELWAFKMLDASAKLPSGILNARSPYFMGSYDECMGLNVFLQDNATQLEIQGKYCNIVMDLNITSIPIVSTVGICIPSVCTEDDIQSILDLFPRIIPQFPKFQLDICYPAEKVLDTGSIVLITVFVIVGALLVIATGYDLAQQFQKWWIRVNLDFMESATEPHENTVQSTTEKQSTLVEILMFFSMYQNGRKLFSTKSSGHELGFLNGIRFLSIAWITLGHVTVMPVYVIGMIENYQYMYDILNNLKGQLVVNASRGVDTFLYLSGLLVAYYTIKELKRSGRISLIFFYLHRYWRLLPPLAMTIAWQATLASYFATGPLSNFIQIQKEDCQQYWWWHILLINNYLSWGTSSSCVLHTWYLAVDFQLYILSPLVLYPLYKKPRIGFCILSFLLASSIIASGIITHIYADGLYEFQIYYYTSFYCRAPPYIVGLLVGYILQEPNLKIKLRPIFVCVCWCIATAMQLSIILGPLHTTRIYPREYKNTGRILEWTLMPFSWSIGLAWVTIACVQGYGGIVKRFLEWRFWTPWARLTYCIYLLHLPIISIFFLTLRQSISPSGFFLAVMFPGMLLFTTFVSIPFSLAFESPMRRLENFLSSPRRSKDSLNHLKSNLKMPTSNSDLKTAELEIVCSN